MYWCATLIALIPGTCPQALLLYLVNSWEANNQFVTATSDVHGDYVAPNVAFVPLPEAI